MAEDMFRQIQMGRFKCGHGFNSRHLQTSATDASGMSHSNAWPGTASCYYIQGSEIRMLLRGQIWQNLLVKAIAEKESFVSDGSCCTLLH
jgi:hypothetical protein